MLEGRKAAQFRPPVLAAIVFAATAAISVTGLASHAVQVQLERTPAAAHGQWWRIFTSLFVQDSVAGAVSNLAFLLILGALAEQVSSRGRWLAAYFGAGIAGELAGLGWQPAGAGNSVAVCGLAGILAVAAWREESRLPRAGSFVVLLWCGALLATWWAPLIGLGIAAAIGSQRLSQVSWRGLRIAVPAAVIATGALLAAVRNIHGAALLAGLLLAFVPVKPTARESRLPARGAQTRT
jgi:membrane associated rhomboid family serine protease